MTARTYPHGHPKRAAAEIRATLIIMLLAFLTCIALGADLERAPYPNWPPVLYEDGSFVAGPIAGCIPRALCAD